MKISLPEPTNLTREPFFAGQRKRLSTATSVFLLSHQDLICCSLVDQRMFYADLSRADGVVVPLRTTTGLLGRHVCTDLIDARRIDNGEWEFVVSNCDDRSITFYASPHYRVMPPGPISVQDDADVRFVHGVRFVPNSENVLVVSSCIGKILILDRAGKTVQSMKLPYRPKDVCWVNGKMIVVACDTNIGPKPQEQGDAFILVLDPDTLEVLAEHPFPLSQFDSCCAYNGRIYVADQANDRVQVFRLEGDSIASIREYGDLPMAHGVHVAHNLLAVACYGDNAVHVRPLSQGVSS